MRSLARFLIALWGVALAACSAPVDTMAQSEGKPKILFLTHSQGFKHSSLALAEKTVSEMGERSGLFEAVVLQGYRQEPGAIDLTMISAEYLQQFDALMMYTTGELPLDSSQKQALLDFVSNGKGFIGVHSASDTFYAWPEYGELVGAYFKGHGASNEVLTLRVEDPAHPAASMLGASWDLADEFYQFWQGEEGQRGTVPFSRARVHVILSVDTEKSEMARQSGMTRGGDYPLAWCRNYGEGRSFYTALGHREDVWTNPVFQEHLLGGIKWALGLAPGDAAPSAAN